MRVTSCTRDDCQIRHTSQFLWCPGAKCQTAYIIKLTMDNVNRQHYSILVIIWKESMLPTRTFDFVTSTKFVNAYCNRSRSLVNLTSTSNVGVVKIDDVTNNSNNQISIAPYASYYINAVTSAWSLARRLDNSCNGSLLHCR